MKTFGQSNSFQQFQQQVQRQQAHHQRLAAGYAWMKQREQNRKSLELKNRKRMSQPNQLGQRPKQQSFETHNRQSTIARPSSAEYSKAQISVVEESGGFARFVKGVIRLLALAAIVYGVMRLL